MQIKDIQLSAILKYVKSTDSLEAAKQQLLEDSISALIVIDNSADVIGILTERDLLKVSPLEFDQVHVSEVCSKALYFVSDEDTVEQASILMINHHCHHLLVTDETSKKLTGLISSLDIVKAHLN